MEDSGDLNQEWTLVVLQLTAMQIPQMFNSCRRTHRKPVLAFPHKCNPRNLLRSRQIPQTPRRCLHSMVWRLHLPPFTRLAHTQEMLAHPPTTHLSQPSQKSISTQQLPPLSKNGSAFE